VFEIAITREGIRHLDRLPAKVCDAAVQAIMGSIAERPVGSASHWLAS
jgi:hypothetical protein